jgi:catalase
MLTGANGEEVKADFSFLTGSSVLFDAVYVPGGDASVASLKKEAEAANFLNEAYQHCKTIAASGLGVELLESAGIVARSGEVAKAASGKAEPGVVSSREASARKISSDFIKAIARHRHWEREATG